MVHSGQNYDYELNEIFFQAVGKSGEPDYFLNGRGAIMRLRLSENVYAKADDEAQVCPDAFLLLCDTNSCLFLQLPPKASVKSPFFHMEAGILF